MSETMSETMAAVGLHGLQSMDKGKHPIAGPV
jgi:hypothetical protein